MGATTVTVNNDPGRRTRQNSVDGTVWVVEAQLTMSASYSTGGDTVDGPVDLGLRRVTGFAVLGATGGYELRLGGTAAAPTIQAYQAGDTEVTALTDLSTAVAAVRVEFWGEE